MRQCYLLILVTLLNSTALAQNEVNVDELNNLESGFANQGQNLDFNNNFQQQSNPIDDSIDQPANLISNDEFEQQDIDVENVAEPEEPLPEASDFAPSSIRKIEQPNLFAGAPPIPGSLRNLIEGEAPEQYDVEMGDTLFDICDQLLDEPGYWPKLWALNPYITNPHFIYPGMKLRFYSGDATTPPFLRVVTEDEVVPVDTGEVRKEELLQQDISALLTRSELPNRTPVMVPEEMEEFPEVDEAFIKQGDIFSSDRFSVIIPAFIFSEKRKYLAKVIGGTAGSFLMDQGQDIVVELDDEDQELTGTLSVLRFSQKVYHPETEDFIGYRYEFIGHINKFTVLDKDEGLLSSRVVFSRLGLKPGDIVVPFLSVRRQVPQKSRSRKIGDQMVIGFEYPNTGLGGRGSFVYFDREKSDELKPGDTVQIFQDVRKSARIFDAGDDLPVFKKRVAEAYVVAQSEKAAIAFIVNDRFEVRIGDKTQ